MAKIKTAVGQLEEGEKERFEAYESNEVRKYLRGKDYNPMNFQSEYRNYFIFRELERCERELKEKLNGSKGICIWGAGVRGTYMAYWLYNKLEIDYYVVDNDVKKRAMVMPNGAFVLSWEETCHNKKVDTIILSNGTFETSVRAQIGEDYKIIEADEALGLLLHLFTFIGNAGEILKLKLSNELDTVLYAISPPPPYYHHHTQVRFLIMMLNPVRIRLFAKKNFRPTGESRFPALAA